ncbi:bile acid:sodium symporter family protein [Vulgatibacter incomptus]|uniref:Putative sodium dependent transporter n=1 Tax=Vulgatibacter incomptus TaxID=1391653 RepID=A0A0K1P7W9_9BACT|nr:bile acid:sodium symporter [Vulgatibacter incomptus]AKU89628.1 hypothetical protein AKJ08_0015 [Vulgatibacter incomptus]AKU93332.1 putative sodium dependent transporter [Vulgatibacter incomptus]
MDVLKLVTTISLVCLMLMEGLGVDVRGLLDLRRRPMLFVRAFIAVDVLVPVAAWIVIVLIRPLRPVVGAVALLAACPIAPLAFRRITQAGGQRETAGAIHIVLSVLAVVTTPVTIVLLGRALGFRAEVEPMPVARQVALGLVVPFAAGIGARALWPELAGKVRRPGARVALLFLMAVFVLVLVFNARALVELGVREYLAMAAFVAAALALGHAVGGGDSRERTVFAMESASRNLGLAFFIASVQVGENVALPILVPYGVVFLIVTAVYLRIVRRLLEKPG